MSALAVAGIGAFTSVGTNTPTTMAALLNNVQLFDGWSGLGPSGAEATVAACPIPRNVDGLSRLSAMAAFALAESAGGLAPSARLPAVVCSAWPEESGVDSKKLLEAIVGERALPIDRKSSSVVARGREGVAEGLRLARAMVHDRRAPGCLLVAVDSLLIRRRLLQLHRDRRLFDPEQNPDGIIPGEGAVAFLLEPPRPSTPLVAGLGMGDGPPEGPSDDLAASEALSSALQKAVVDGQAEPNRLTCAAVDDTSSRIGQEFAMAKTRPPLQGARELQVFYPSICVGEAGATTPLLGMAMLAFFMSKGVVSGPGLAVFTSAGRSRVAVAMMPPGATRRR
jgi:hypothetical protein